MKLLVPVKRVPDYKAKLKVRSDGSGIETEGIKWIVNPFDEIAVEEAIRLREQSKASEVIVVTVGPADAVKQLRDALALGADRAVHVKYDGDIDSDLAARVLAAVYARDSYGAVIMGKQAIDSDANQTAQLLAARLNLPQACFASKVVIQGDSAVVTREVDGGLETVKVGVPCVISTDLRLNEPRYASLPNIMKAKNKPLETLTLEALGVEPTTKVRVLRMSPPPRRQAGRKVNSVADLITALQSEAKVL
jgi:electron transfer flavoprotein beta subunit